MLMGGMKPFPEPHHGRDPIGNPIGPARPVFPSYKKGGRVRRTGLALVHRGEKIIPAKKRSSVSRTMGGAKKSKLEKIGHELKVNPPRILAKTRAKKGAKRANKQRVAILLSKARRAGAKV
jgi:hypothetical protein